MPAKKRKRTKLRTIAPVRRTPDQLQKLLANAPEEFFIRHLPITISTLDFPDRLPSLYVPVVEYIDLASRLGGLQQAYRRTKNGTYLVSAFLTSYKLGLYPPKWVLNALASAFQNYWNDPAAKSVDRYLGLQFGRGREPAYKARVRLAQHRGLATDMWLLIQKFSLTIDEAADVVSTNLEISSLRATKVRWDVKLSSTFTSESLSKLYSSKWKRQFDLTTEHYNLLSACYSEDFWLSFLRGLSLKGIHRSLKAKLQLDTHHS